MTDLTHLLEGLPAAWRARSTIWVTFARVRSLPAVGVRERAARSLRRLADRIDGRESVIMSVTGDISTDAVREAWGAAAHAFLEAARKGARMEMIDGLVKEDVDAR